MKWFSSLLQRRPVVVGRTRDSAYRNRKFNMPSVWYSEEHLVLWIQFLRERCSEGYITARKLREKVRAAICACGAQRREVGCLPGDNGNRTEHYRDVIRQELDRKAANV